MHMKIFTNKIGTTISTIKGDALYSHTEIEDCNNKWNDNWYTNKGEYCIHELNLHHVYIIH